MSTAPACAPPGSVPSSPAPGRPGWPAMAPQQQPVAEGALPRPRSGSGSSDDIAITIPVAASFGSPMLGARGAARGQRIHPLPTATVHTEGPHV